MWNKRIDIKKEDVINTYVNEKLSLRNCAKKFGCDRDVITRILKENNIHIRTLSEEKKLHPTSYWKGKKRPDCWNKGKKCPQLQGENNPNWKGGKLGDEKDRKSVDMIMWRLKVYERDLFTCQMCNEKGGRLNSHHIHPYVDYPKLRFNLDNGITLCEKCHKSIKNKEYQYIEFFSDKLKNRVNCGNIQNGQSAAKPEDYDKASGRFNEQD